MVEGHFTFLLLKKVNEHEEPKILPQKIFKRRSTLIYRGELFSWTSEST